MFGLLNPDDYEKGLEEAWERAKPAGSTVTVKEKLAKLSKQNAPHWETWNKAGGLQYEDEEHRCPACSDQVKKAFLLLGRRRRGVSGFSAEAADVPDLHSARKRLHLRQFALDTFATTKWSRKHPFASSSKGAATEAPERLDSRALYDCRIRWKLPTAPSGPDAESAPGIPSGLEYLYEQPDTCLLVFPGTGAKPLRPSAARV
eukprot:g32061.t1